eukprot:m.192420 g.192420  ORF g.192420 m.192420 type:complete len:338 (-) comp15654_c0_seq1:199-1212(-)
MAQPNKIQETRFDEERSIAHFHTLSGKAFHAIMATDVSWPNFLLSVLFLVVVYFGGSLSPGQWPVTEANHGLFDFPKPGREQVPSWVLFLIPALFSIVIVLVELQLNLSGTGRSRKIFALNVVFGLWEAFFVTLALTQLGKYWVSEPRPDFMSRCRPDGTYEYDNVTGFVICNGDEDEIDEGRLSFPSGHSSASMVNGVYCTAYFVWTAYYRDIETVYRCGPHWRSRGWRQLAHMLFFLLAFPLILGLAITCSRVVDHRHSPADVVAGAFLGTIIAMLVFSRVVTESDYDAEHAEHHEKRHYKQRFSVHYNKRSSDMDSLQQQTKSSKESTVSVLVF